MTLAAMLAMVMVAAAPALAQDTPLIDQSEDNSGEGGNQYNAAGVNCTQILQQVGGDQYAGAVGVGGATGGDTAGGGGTGGTGDDNGTDNGDDVAEENQEEAGDTAAANNQTFTAEQIQECLAIAGNNNAAVQNVGDTVVGVEGVDDDGDGTVDESDGSEGAAAGASASAGGASASAGGAEGGAAASAGGSAAGATLPDTGGYSLIALGAGALLVAGGLVVRRIVR
jgi:LPXTG-motif cell wall-anchored protein